MISRVLIKEHLGFDKVELNFKAGISVFTGASGAGKSVLMGAIMSAFALKDSEAKLVEADVEASFNMSDVGIENEPINSFKMVREKSVRYFINSQSIAKKSLSLIASEQIKYFGAKGLGELNGERFLRLLDALVKDKNHEINLKSAKELFYEYTKLKNELDELNEAENKIEELKEFAKFEIEKIEAINPKVGEFDELLEIKKKLSKKDKIEAAWQKAQRIYELEGAVIEALNISDLNSDFFADAINELRVLQESLNMDWLDEVDVESVLDRIEALNSLIKRYGSEEEALLTLQSKRAELNKYENISFQKSELEAKFNKLYKDLSGLCANITQARKGALGDLESLLNGYLSELYMPSLKASLSEVSFSESGADALSFEVAGVNLNKMSSGEINRLRLAFIASETQVLNQGSGVIILDEIDANLSGKEAMSIANVLVKIAKRYQIFAISHQPQLSSRADAHFLVEKTQDGSSVRQLKDSERAPELARMISGEVVSDEALRFAKGLLESVKA